MRWSLLATFALAVMGMIASDASSQSPSTSAALTVTQDFSENGARLIAFLPYADDPDLHVLDTASGRVRRLTFGAKVDGGFAWSPDSRRMAYTQCVPDAHPDDRTCDLYLMSDDGTGTRRLTRTPYTREWDPVWSPTGRSIAFSRIGVGIHETTYFIVNDDASDLRKLSQNRRMEAGLAWSPDGSRVAFVVSRSQAGQGAPWELRVARADGSGQRRLALNAEAPAWSQDGQTIAFERCRRRDVTGYYCESRDVYVVNARGGAVRALTRTRTRDERNPQWSPDGRRLSFSAFPGFYDMRVDGTGVRRVLNWAYGPEWSTDWRHVAYLAQCAPGFESNCHLRISSSRGDNIQRLLPGQPIGVFAWEGTASAS